MFQPLHDYVLVERTEAAEKTDGGLYLPQINREKTQEGTVISVGPGFVLETGQIMPLSLKEGDKILFDKSQGQEVSLNGKTFLVLKEINILGKLS